VSERYLDETHIVSKRCESVEVCLACAWLTVVVVLFWGNFGMFPLFIFC